MAGIPLPVALAVNGIAVRTYAPQDAAALHAAYTAIAGGLPHGLLPDELELHAALTTPHPLVDDLQCLVGEHQGTAAAFVLVGRLRDAQPWLGAMAGEGFILGPFAKQDNEAADALLIAAHRHMRDRGAHLRWACIPLEEPILPFYNAGFGGMSDRLPHLIRVLTRNGFRIRYRELNLEWSGTLPEPAAVPPHIHTQIEPENAHITRITLSSAAENIGYCRISLVCPSRGRNPLGTRIGYVCGLGVRETYRGAGWGRLLMHLGMRRLLEMGATRTWLTTGAENRTAQTLYYSLGFRVVDSCVTLAREPLGSGQDQQHKGISG